MRKERRVGWKLEKSMKIRLEFGCPLYNGEVVASVWKVVELGGKKDYFLLKKLMDDSQDNQTSPHFWTFNWLCIAWQTQLILATQFEPTPPTHPSPTLQVPL